MPMQTFDVYLYFDGMGRASTALHDSSPTSSHDENLMLILTFRSSDS
jgi:hypothetical protein